MKEEKNMIEVRKLKKHFGGVKAVDSVSIKIPKGKVTAIIGPNGSGKTTLFNLISGIVKEDSGRVLLNGKDITNEKDSDRSKFGISRTFQHVRLFKDLSIMDHFIVAKNSDKNLLKKIFSNGKDYTKEIKETLRLIGLDKDIHTKASDLSYGQRKLLDIGIGLLKKHEVLLLDEPVAGINPALRKQIKNLIKELQDKGETIVIIEHDMEFVMDISDYVICLDAGEIIFEGSAKEAQKSKRVLEAYLGSD